MLKFEPVVDQKGNIHSQHQVSDDKDNFEGQVLKDNL